MKKIIEHLGLPETAKEADAIKAIKAIEAAQSAAETVLNADEYKAKLQTQEVKILQLQKRINQLT